MLVGRDSTLTRYKVPIVSVVRDTEVNEWHLTMNGVTVILRGVDGLSYGSRAPWELDQMRKLWRRERTECGCVTCLEELACG